MRKIPKWVYPFASLFIVLFLVRLLNIPQEGIVSHGILCVVFLLLWCGLWMLADWIKTKDTIACKTIARIIKLVVVVQCLAAVAFIVYALTEL